MFVIFQCYYLLLTCIYVSLNSFFKKFKFIFERQREREREREGGMVGGTEREGERESLTGSAMSAQSQIQGSIPRTYEIMT